jgi:PNKP adenylyltransferase domain, C-terminal region
VSGLDVAGPQSRIERRAVNAGLFRDAYARYCGPPRTAGAELRRPLRVHQAVFGVLGLESEPVDPRL